MAPPTERWVAVPGGRYSRSLTATGHRSCSSMPASPTCGPGIRWSLAWWRPASGRSATTCGAFGRSTTEDVAFSNRADLVAVLDALGRRPGRARREQPGRPRSPSTPRSSSPTGSWRSSVSGPGSVGSKVRSRPRSRRCSRRGIGSTTAEPRDVDALVDLEVRLWVDGPGQAPTRSRPTIREAVRDDGTPAPPARPVDGRPIVLDPTSGRRALADLRCPGPGRRRHAGCEWRGRDRPPSRGARPERPGGPSSRCRPHDRDGSPGPARRADRGIPSPARHVVVGRWAAVTTVEWRRG